MSHSRLPSVVGLGYVGLPVAVSLARAGRPGGVPVVAFDINERRITELKAGHDTTNEVAPDVLTTAATNLHYTTDPTELARADFHIVTVPTPITAARRPDFAPLRAASRTLAAILKPGDIVVYESTVYPGATEEICVPILEAGSGLSLGRDFAVGYSPERINPGDHFHRFETINKVVSASDPKTLETVAAVYASVIQADIHKAPNIKTAEAAKVIENTQRDLNIALMNELSLIFHRLGIDTADVLAAARTKWNFLPFSPGLVGGHCIGVDPYYLTDRAEQVGYHPQVILAGRRINDGMGAWIAQETVKRVLLRPVFEKRVTILGATFKENVPDLRNTRVLDILRELQAFGISVQLHDPQADPGEMRHELGIDPVSLEDLAPADAVILAVPHQSYLDAGWPLVTGCLRDGCGPVIDVKSCLPRETVPDGVALWRL